jgi:hypothetical protein
MPRAVMEMPGAVAELPEAVAELPGAMAKTPRAMAAPEPYDTPKVASPARWAAGYVE